MGKFIQKYHDYIQKDLNIIINELKSKINNSSDEDLDLDLVYKTGQLHNFLNQSKIQQASIYLPGYYYLYCYEAIVDLQNRFPQETYKDLCSSIKYYCRKNFFKFNGFRLEDKNKINTLSEESELIHEIINLKLNINLSDYGKAYLSYLENRLNHLQTKPEWLCSLALSSLTSYIVYKFLFCLRIYVDHKYDWGYSDRFGWFITIFIGVFLTLLKMSELKKFNKYITIIFSKYRILTSKCIYYIQFIYSDIL